MLIGKEWLTISDAKENRRLDDPEDFVRLEIATAFDQGIWVIPVLVQGATMPALQELPDELSRLAHINAFELSHSRWDHDVRRLKKRLGISCADCVNSLLIFLSPIIASAIVILGAINCYSTIIEMLSAASTATATSIPPTDAPTTTPKYHKIRVKHTRKCLDVLDSGAEDGTNVVQWNCRWGSDNQLWQLVEAGDEYHIIRVMHSGKCLSVLGNELQDGANVAQWDCEWGGDNQLWRFEPPLVQ